MRIPFLQNAPQNNKGKKKTLSNMLSNYTKTRGVCHIVALPFTLKSTLRQKKNDGNSNISPCKNIIFKKSSRRNQNPSRNYNSMITNLKFQHKPKYHLSKKNPHIKIDLLLLPRGPKSIKLLYSVMNLNTISLPLVGKAKKLRRVFFFPSEVLVVAPCWPD
jgi:hypothetical protein